MVPPSNLLQPGAAQFSGVALLNASTDLLALLTAEGALLWVNASFVQQSGRSAQALSAQTVWTLLAAEPTTGDGPWAQVHRAWAQGEATNSAELAWLHPDGEPRWGRLTLTPLTADRPLPRAAWLLVLQDTTALAQARLEAQHLAELLDTAQDFGRLGLWERKLPLGAGRWDRHMFRFFGLPPKEGVPDFNEVARRIHPDDHPGEKYRASAHAPGRYESRYRITAPGEPLRHVHAQWEVKGDATGTPALITGIMVDDTEAYELVESINKTSAQLKLAVELGNIAIWRHDLKTQRIHCNERGFAMVGLPPRAAGVPLAEVKSLIHPDDLSRVRATAVQAIHTERPVDMEARYRHADGRWRYVLTRRMVQRDAAGVPVEFIGVALDVSEQVEHTRQTSEMAKRLEIAAAAAGLGVWGRDPVNRRAEWNLQMFEIVGRASAQGLPSRNEWVEQIIHPDDRAKMRLAHAEMLASNGSTVEHEYRIVRPDGEVRWLINRSRHELHKGRSMLLGITIDVTERVRTEAALRQANERVALATHGAGIGTWERDVQRDLAQWDNQMYALRGLRPDCGKSPDALRFDLAHPEDLPRILEANAASVRTGKLCTYEFRVRMPDGSHRWLASRSLPLYDDKGLPLRQLGVNWDIHERVTAEAERQDKLIAQRENQAKTDFLSRMSHELRTPLNAVLGFTQLLQLDQAQFSEAQGNKLGHIRAAGEHLLSLINDVLDLSSLASGQLKADLQAVPLAEALSEALPLVEALAQAQGVSLHIDAVQQVMQGDRTRIRQVLINLLSNAIKYNKAQGSVHVSSHLEDAAVVLRVQDTGRGMSPQQLSKLFEPFNRLGLEREAIPGTGIGLAVVKALVEHMGGHLAVRSEVGVGSVFEVRLPQHSTATAGSTSTSTSTNTNTNINISTDTRLSTPTQGQRSGMVLYIEDNPVNLILVQELVRGPAGLSIACEETGQAGIERALTLQPDLILVDIQLPDIDGFEVLRRLRAEPRTARIPCIALSANAMPEDIARALALGFDDYWTKPIEFSLFLTALDQRFPRA